LRNSHPTSTAKADDAASAEKDDGLLGESQPSEADTSTAETDLTDLANVRHLWAQVEKEVKARRRGLATMFGGSRAHVDSLSGGLLIELPTTANFAKNTLERPESQEYVRDAVKQVFGQNLKLTYVLGAPDGVSEEAKPASTAAPAAAPAVIAPSVDIYDDATAATTAPGEPTIVGNDTNIVGFSDSASTASFNDGSAAAPTGSSDTAASVSFSDGTTVAPTGSGDTIVAPAGDGSISFEEMLAASFGTSITVEELPSNKGDI
jgi:hypothetical protein